MSLPTHIKAQQKPLDPQNRWLPLPTLRRFCLSAQCLFSEDQADEGRQDMDTLWKQVLSQTQCKPQLCDQNLLEGELA